MMYLQGCALLPLGACLAVSIMYFMSSSFTGVFLNMRVVFRWVAVSSMFIDCFWCLWFYCLMVFTGGGGGCSFVRLFFLFAFVLSDEVG